jgi:hypothetical protein
VTSTAPRPPAGLGKAGKAVWRGITSVYQLDPRETVTLAAACRAADDIAALEGALAEGELVVAGSAGQPVLNGLVAELRQGRLALARLLGRLDLPPVEAPQLTAAQERSRRAAVSRWEMHRGRVRKAEADGAAS